MTSPQLTPLPIDKALPDIRQAFLKSQNLIITASPGSGKTTRIPPAALAWVQNQILVLEPRRVAALAAASRIAEENSWTLGHEVGYQVRFENKTSAQTRLKFLTEALLVRQMISDLELKNVDLVILDEFHERSHHVDLALGLLRELQLMGHPIKLVVMSASLESQKISDYLGSAPILQVPGQLYDLEIEYSNRPQLIRTLPEFFERVASQVKLHSSKTSKDTLVFLPGVREIQKVESQLSPWASESQTLVQTLYAQKSLDEQKSILQKSNRKRIILSTNLAESALTIDGVGLVIDSGLERRVEFDDKTETEKINLQRISKASALQRAGRAARQFPGKCLRLWTKSDELSFPEQIPAEILKIDLTSSLLFLAAQGVSNFDSFAWFEKPNSKYITWAQSELQKLELLDLQNSLTNLGRQTMRFPLSPRLGKILTLASPLQLFDEACELIALLLEKDILNHTPEHLNAPVECDLLNRWSLWKDNSRDLDFRNLQQVERASQQLKKMQTHKTRSASADKEIWQSLQKLIVHGFADRLCRRRAKNSERGLRVGGRGVALANESIVKKSEFFVPLKSMDVESMNETKISWACGFSARQLKEWFQPQIQKKSQIVFDEQRNRFIRKSQSFLQDLGIDEAVISEPLPAEIQEHLPEYLLASWPELIRKNESLQHWYLRYEFIQNSSSDPAWSLNPETLAAICEQLAFGHKSLEEIENLDVVYYMENSMPQDVKKNWNQQWPLTWTAPNGRNIKIHYEAGKNPFVEIKIQEIFGLKIHPKMFGQDLPLVFHLLAPSQRPVQVTADIPGFWSGSYQEVRKELKPRYPKHSWPEDPRNADPEAPKPRRLRQG